MIKEHPEKALVDCRELKIGDIFYFTEYWNFSISSKCILTKEAIHYRDSGHKSNYYSVLDEDAVIEYVSENGDNGWLFGGDYNCDPCRNTVNCNYIFRNLKDAEEHTETEKILWMIKNGETKFNNN